MTGCVFCDHDEIEWTRVAVSDRDTDRDTEVSVCINHYDAIFPSFDQ